MRPSYLYNGNPHTWKDGIYTKWDLGCLSISDVCEVFQVEDNYNTQLKMNMKKKQF